MKSSAITAVDINKYYGTLKAVNDLKFSVREGECFGLLGPNGAGKSTMMKMLYAKAWRNSVDDSELKIFGLDPAFDQLKIKYISGIVSQDNNLDSEVNVTENLILYAKMYQLSKKQAEERIEELLEFMELTDKKKQLISELSGGMKRRLVIARALINQPKFLILDEPTTGLDPQVRQLIWNKLRKLKNDGVTILLTTHYMEEAFEICDRILIMHKGEKILEGNPKELLKTEIEKYALQIYSKEKQIEVESIINQMTNETVRVEKHQESFFLYSHSLDAFQSITANLLPEEFFIRNSNLEDLFLKTTGRALNE